MAIRAKCEGENIAAYVEDLSWLCRKAGTNMDEATKLYHFMKGVAVDVFQLLVVRSPITVTEFCNPCKKFEEVEGNRLKLLSCIPKTTKGSGGMFLATFDVRSCGHPCYRERSCS